MRLTKPKVPRSHAANPAVYAYESYSAAADNTSTSSVNILPRQQEDKLSGVHKDAALNVIGDMVAAASVSAASTRNPRVVAATTIIIGIRSVQTNCLSCHNGN